MRILVAGDWHGNSLFVQNLFARYIEFLEIDLVIQVGDFGGESGWKYPTFLDNLEELSRKYQTEIWFIDGNHEDFEKLFALVRDFNQLNAVRPGINYIPRGYKFELDGVTFMGFGGAYSVDKAKRSPYINWWPQEMPTDEEVQRAADAGEVDILITHDAPEGSPVMFYAPFDLSPIAGADYSRSQVRKVVDLVKPKQIIHGHYHFRYKDRVEFPHGLTDILCLDADYTATNWGDTFTVIDTKEWNGNKK